MVFAAIQYSVAEPETPKVEVYSKDIKIEDSVYTPFYEVETEQDHSQGASHRWIRLGVYFTTEGEWIDEINVRQLAHIHVDQKDVPSVLEETVHYINIAPGDHYVYVYPHPSYIKRYDIDDSDMDSAAQISINGKVVAQKETSRKVKKGWSNLAGGVETKNYLLNHAETPFWFIKYDFKGMRLFKDRLPYTHELHTLYLPSAVRFSITDTGAKKLPPTFPILFELITIAPARNYCEAA